jgi:hypothetical protein
MISVANPATYSLLILGSVAGDICVAGLSSSALIADLNPRMPSPILLPNSGSFFGAEDKQGDTKNDQQMNGLKQSFKHGALLNLSPPAEFL